MGSRELALAHKTLCIVNSIKLVFTQKLGKGNKPTPGEKFANQSNDQTTECDIERLRASL